MADPKLYLGIDNCFAYKRWTLPEEWMRVIHELGLKYVEASADTELDPLYMGPEHTKRWIEIARKECEPTPPPGSPTGRRKCAAASSTTG